MRRLLLLMAAAFLTVACTGGESTNVVPPTTTSIQETLDLVTVVPSSARPDEVVQIQGSRLTEYVNGDIRLQLRLIGGGDADLALLGTFGVDGTGQIGRATASIPTQTNAPTAANPEPTPVRSGHWLIVPEDDFDSVLGVLTIEG